MSITVRRTVAGDLTFWLSMITTIIAVIIGAVYTLYASRAITEELLAEAQQTADEFSQLLTLPLYNFDQAAAQEIANIYLTSGQVSGLRITIEGIGEITNSLPVVSSSLPPIAKTLSKDNLLLGTMELAFSDLPVRKARKQAIWTTLASILVILLIYLGFLRLILSRILITPLNMVGFHLKEIASGAHDGTIPSVPQQDLNTIVTAANRMSQEITVRTQALEDSERNYRQIYNSTSDAIFIHDVTNSTLIDVNQTMLDMFGYSREETLALDIGELSQGEPPYSNQEAKVMFDKTLHEGPQLFKWLARRKDGELFWLEVALKKAIINDQEVILAMARDVSQRQKLEEELRQSQKMEAIGTLAGGIAHDFNNILTAILGYTELAQLKAEKPSPLYSDLQQVKKASKRARNLVRQILTFSRKQPVERMKLHMAPIVEEAVHLLRSSLPTSVKIKLNLQSQATVLMDPGQMHQVIMNLCTNGYHAMPNASGTLTISLQDIHVNPRRIVDTVDLEVGDHVILEVQDDGYGMDKATREKIFEPYYTTKETDKGTGLGLAVVHGIAQSHHGQITVSSAPNRGTTVRLYLPVTVGPSAPHRPQPELTDGPHNKRVMVVDDEESIRDLMSQLLNHGGYQVDAFEDGSAAWRALSADPSRWDLLITDQTMPEMTGMELASKASELCPDLPIILCSGYGDAHNNDQQNGRLISGYLQKPVTLQELLVTTAQVLQASVQRKEQ